MLISQLKEKGFYVTQYKNCDNKYIAKIWLHGNYITTITSMDYFGEWKTEIHNQKVDLNYFIQK
jgi:hypothetical protein